MKDKKIVNYRSQVIMCSVFLLNTAYLYYRAFYTLNPENLFFSLLLLSAEIFGFISLSLFFFQIWQPKFRKGLPPLKGVTVDVFIATYNEDLDLVRRTAIACIKMHYPHKTYILDDGNRPEFKKMAQQIGCQYIARSENTHAKAGNLNNSLKETSGDFIAIFDADHIPNVNFIEKTLGYFQDKEIAFVQIPQSFYNTDSFCHDENTFFYRFIMPHLDHWNAAFFCGTGALFRRKALEDVGGFSTSSSTEDLLTSIQLYKKGWKSAYHNEALSYGLAAMDMENHTKQKMRWCKGNIRSLLFISPFYSKGLSFPQKLCFFALLLGWFSGFPSLIFFLVPCISLLTNTQLMIVSGPFFYLICLGFLTILMTGIHLVSGKYFSILNDQKYRMLNFFILIKGVISAFISKKDLFTVTSKTATNKLFAVLYLYPQILIAVFCFSSVVWASLEFLTGITESPFKLLILSVWCILTGNLAISTIRKVSFTHSLRKAYRIRHKVPVEIRWNDNEGQRCFETGTTININEKGLLFTTNAKFQKNEKVEITLPVTEDPIHVLAVIMHCNKTHDPSKGQFSYGLKFEDLSENALQAISSFCLTTVLPQRLHGYRIHPEFIKARLPLLLNTKKGTHHWKHLHFEELSSLNLKDKNNRSLSKKMTPSAVRTFLQLNNSLIKIRDPISKSMKINS